MLGLQPAVMKSHLGNPGTGYFAFPTLYPLFFNKKENNQHPARIKMYPTRSSQNNREQSQRLYVKREEMDGWKGQGFTGDSNKPYANTKQRTVNGVRLKAWGGEKGMQM